MSKNLPKAIFPGKRPLPSETAKPVTLRFTISAEANATLEAIAREAGMSTAEAAAVIFQAKIDKHEQLREEIEEKVKQAFSREYDHFLEELARINEPNEQLKSLLLELLPSLKDRLQKREPN